MTLASSPYEICLMLQAKFGDSMWLRVFVFTYNFKNYAIPTKNSEIFSKNSQTT